MGYIFLFFSVLSIGGALFAPGEPMAQRIVWLIVGLPLGYVGYRLATRKSSAAKKSKDAFNSIDFVKTADYKNFFNDTGIAINKNAKKILLASPKKVKMYDFSQIKRWHYKCNSGGMTTSGGLGGVFHNIGQISMNLATSGFFVEVKDIDFPEWQIYFGHNSRNPTPLDEMKKWMEIFDQFVNENV